MIDTDDALFTLIRESTLAAIQEAGLSTAYSDGTERGAPASSGKFPPSGSVETGGQSRVLPKDSEADRTTTEAECRDEPHAHGVSPLSTGGPAPTDTGGAFNAGGGGKPTGGELPPPTHHVSDEHFTQHPVMDKGDHVSASSANAWGGHELTNGEKLLEVHGFPRPELRCGTCAHSKLIHSISGDMCMVCAPKGSTHHFVDQPDLTPKLQTIPLAAGCNLDFAGYVGPARSGNTSSGRVTETVFVGNVVDLHNRMFSDEQQALLRLDDMHEAITSYMSKDDDPGVHSARNNASNYNAHSVAAHRSSLQAFNSGDSHDHVVAGEHHNLAASAAEKAAGDYPDGHQARRDFKTAGRYHEAAAHAHKLGASAAKVGAVARRHEYNMPGVTSY